MVEELTINWRRVEAGFADFCMGYFDEKLIAVYQVGFAEESNEDFNRVNSNILLFFERIILAFFHYIFVKEYAITDANENLKPKLDSLNGVFDILSSSIAHVLCMFTSVVNYNKLILRVGFT